MIKSGEIQKIAHEQGVRDTQIEKDYVLGWILKGISQNPYLKEYLIFKGGTVLKKVWFTDYRFSEDMDFTFLGDDWSKSKIESKFQSVCEWIYEESRIKINISSEEGSADQYRGYLSYQGPLGGSKDIKLDISTNELIYYAIEERIVLDDYSDKEQDYRIKVYCLEESLAEKLRCVLQRSIPRDIYDIWYLTEEAGIDIEEVAFGFAEKSKHKEKDPLSLIDTFHKKEKKYKANWETSLDHQIKNLPDFDGVWRGLLAEAKKLIALLKS